ncbi:hypothetical protein RHCRD62_10741 [Rhodococcus sp. RD6.2]|nr:hypothetical protein RHCRD62_10741 [Rhodococcus sp. RD6.2]
MDRGRLPHPRGDLGRVPRPHPQRRAERHRGGPQCAADRPARAHRGARPVPAVAAVANAPGVVDLAEAAVVRHQPHRGRYRSAADRVRGQAVVDPSARDLRFGAARLRADGSVPRRKHFPPTLLDVEMNA